MSDKSIMDLKCSTTINADEIVYTWEIKNFSINGKKTGEMISSPMFPNSPGQTLWSLSLYPKGISDNHSGYLSLRLCLRRSNQVNVETDYSLCFLDSNESEVWQVTRHYLFDTKNYIDGPFDIISQVDLKSLLTNDKLTIRCKIKAGINVTNVWSENSSSKQASLHQLQQDFLKCALSEKYTDITLMVNEIPIRAHKAILSARSPVFSAMFDNMMDQNKNIAIIQDINYEVAAELIQFIYTGEVYKLEKLASPLLIAADKYALYDLKDMCEKFLHKNLTINTVMDSLCLADRYDAKELKTKAIDFISKNTKEVSDTVRYKELEQINPTLITAVFRLISSK